MCTTVLRCLSIGRGLAPICRLNRQPTFHRVSRPWPAASKQLFVGQAVPDSKRLHLYGQDEQDFCAGHPVHPVNPVNPVNPVQKTDNKIHACCPKAVAPIDAGPSIASAITAAHLAEGVPVVPVGQAVPDKTAPPLR